LAGIGQAQRPRRPRQPGAGQAADLRGDVGANADHALAFRIHQPEGLLGGGRTGAGEQGFLKFQQRCVDALIAMGGEAFHDRRHGFRLKLGLRRQQIAQSDRQQGGVNGRFVHENRILFAGDGSNGPKPAGFFRRTRKISAK
jgi:hypothetical protein